METNAIKTKKTNSKDTNKNSTAKSKVIVSLNNQCCLKMYDYMIF